MNIFIIWLAILLPILVVVGLVLVVVGLEFVESLMRKANFKHPILLTLLICGLPITFILAYIISIVVKLNI